MELPWKKPWLALLVAIVLVPIFGSDGCFLEEKRALLDFKAAYGNELSLLLPSWVDHPKSNCCGWERVTCDSSSGHVIDLSLGRGQYVLKCSLRYLLNWSLFVSFTELRSLNLSGNCFEGLVEKEDYRSKSTLKLETLDLGYNYLDESTMGFLTALPSLKILNLSNNDIGGPFPMKELSLLQNLELLDLSFNHLNSTFTTPDYRSKSTLKLETLDLGNNAFNESIMEFLTALPSLKNLILKFNNIGGPFPMKELSLLQNLELLDLSYNNDFTCNFTTQDYRFKSTPKKLETLDLSGNYLNHQGIMEVLSNLPFLKNLILTEAGINGSFPMKELSLLQNLELLDLSGNNFTSINATQVLGNLSKLKVLKLRWSYVNGPFPNQGLCKMKQLQELDLSMNDLTGTLDPCLGNLTSLRTLDLLENSLSGSIPTTFIARLASLEYLSLSYNEFEGLFSLSILGNHSKLKVLELNNNSKTFRVETENFPWIPSFQLERLDISHCQVNLLTKRIPTFLSYQNGLRHIDISGNDLVGMFPSWLLVNNPKLADMVCLNDNSFTGPFELPTYLNHHLDQVYFLDLSNNQIQGELPNNIGVFFPSLEYFDVSSNMFDGHIPASIGEMSSLERLYLGHNNFSGKVPKHIFNGCFLLDLRMDNNRLNGTLPSGIGKLDLVVLTASSNNFEGAIPEELCQPAVLDLSRNKLSGALPSCSYIPRFFFLQENNLTGTITLKEASLSDSVVAIDLSDNKLTGTIPESIYGYEDMIFLLLADNQLQGQLSSKICQLQNIKILDLSRNNLTGSIPSCFNNLSFGENILHDIPPLDGYGFPMGAEVQFKTKGSPLLFKGDILYKMSGLDLSYNQLTGQIPHQMGYLHSLHALDLSHNLLNGPIPESFQKLESIESLDLSHNNLSGQIPHGLQDLHFLSNFNVSYNNLSGRAPEKGQFGTFDESSYKGNPYLSWNNSNRGIATPPPPPTPLNDGEKNDSTIDFTSFYWSFGGSYVMILVLLVTILWINPYWRRAWFYFAGRCLDTCFSQFLEDAVF